MRKLLNILPLVFVLMVSVLGSAQVSYVNRAFEAYKKGEIAIACTYSDSSVMEVGSPSDPQTWLIRGFVYYDKFTKLDKMSRDAESRDVAEEAFSKILELDTAGNFTEKANKGLYNIAVSYNNEAARSMNDKDYHLAGESFDNFRRLMKIARPNVDLRAKNIEFYNSLGFILHATYNSDKKGQAELWDKAIDAYSKTLEIDSLNVDANYEIGILYYNKGVDLLLSIPEDGSMEVIFDTQDKTVVLFLKSRPYMVKAHQLDPKNIDILTGLEGIDYELNQPEKVEMWRKKKKELQESNE